MEIWKDVLGYENFYEVSNLGNVRSKERIVIEKNGKQKLLKSKLLKFRPAKRGNYHTVCLSKNGLVKNMKVHRIVMITFNGLSNLTVNHINGNKQDNRLENLEYLSNIDNLKHYHNNNPNHNVLNKGFKFIDLKTNKIYESKRQLCRSIYQEFGLKNPYSLIKLINDKYFDRFIAIK